jgi:hypothetical protein
LQSELERAEKDAKKRLRKVEKDAAALQDKVLALVGQKSSKEAPQESDEQKPAEKKPVAKKPGQKLAGSSEGAETSTTSESSSGTTAKVPTSPQSAPRKRAPAQKASARSTTSGQPTVAQLRSEAKTKGIKGYSTMTKAQLLDALG